MHESVGMLQSMMTLICKITPHVIGLVFDNLDIYYPTLLCDLSRARLVAQERSVGAAPTLQPVSDDAASSYSSPQNEMMTEEGVWAHSIARPERGALLLAHPQMFERSQQVCVLLLGDSCIGVCSY